AVEVNQRGLVDKVLARYPEEFTVFRELLQNADDAEAKNFAIEFQLETPRECARNGTKPDLNSAKSTGSGILTFSSNKVFKWLVKNDGVPFQDTDWKRLTKIAEGNPDEQKIGAFGVGFFSVFSVTDKPIVKSNGMQSFNYACVSLIGCCRKDGEEINPDSGNWTVIEMELKLESTVARIFELTRFLVTSMTFLANVQYITISLDGTELSRLTKTRNKASQSIVIPKHMVKRCGTMNVTSVDLICMYLLHLSKSAKL
ncbi:histidine kinase-like ATPase, partial [Suillus paluster]|uniref:histidine kinase-like ATPase n=1 Tax=Suillus paluster TaxID=48578 RepID=UPI001B867C72